MNGLGCIIILALVIGIAIVEAVRHQEFWDGFDEKDK